MRTGLDWADVCDDLAMSVSARTCGRKRKKTMTDPHEPMRDVRGSPMLSATSDTEPRSLRPLKTTGIIVSLFSSLSRDDSCRTYLCTLAERAGRKERDSP